MWIVLFLQDRCRHGAMGIELELGAIPQQFWVMKHISDILHMSQNIPKHFCTSRSSNISQK